MEIQEWEVWHTYATFFNDKIPDLNKVAKLLVKNRIAELVVHSDGDFYWSSKDEIRQGVMEFESPEFINRNKAHFKPKNGKSLDYGAFVKECLFIAARMKFGNNRLFGDDITFMEPNLQIFSGLCKLVNKESKFEVNCYPIMTLFSTGILVVSLRVIGPTNGIRLEDFIKYGENLFMLSFDEAKCPPGFGIWAPTAYYLSHFSTFTFVKRFMMNVLYEHHKIEFEKTKTREKIGDFEFDLAALTRGDEKESLSGLARTIFGLIGLFINVGAKHPIWNYSKKQNEQGDFWKGRPNVYIIRHSNQAASAKDNFEQNKDDFIKILAQGQDINEKNKEVFAAEDLRYFNDYNVFITSVITLTIWSKEGATADAEFADANHGHLIYEKHVLAEILEYGHILYRAIIDRLLRQYDSENVFSMKKDLAKLKYKMNNLGPFGEIWEMLKTGWKEYGIENLQNYLDKLTEIQSSYIDWKDNKESAIRDRILTIALGVLAAPSIADAIIIPLWKYLKFWMPKNEMLQNPFITTITLSFLLLCFLPFLIGKKKKNIS
jgi:hypothetical protein